MNIPITTNIKELSHVVSNNFSDKSEIFKKTKKRSADRYNCWGFTAFFLDWEKQLYWMEEYEMERLLEKHTVKVTPRNVKKGDIAVYRYPWTHDLRHTAIVIDKDKILHKPGGYSLETTKIRKNLYTGQNTSITFRRLKESV